MNIFQPRPFSIFALITIVLCLWMALFKFQAPTRSLLPLGTPAQKSESVPIGAQVSFLLPIAPAFEVFHGVMSHDSVRNLEPFSENATISWFLQKHPQWFPSRLMIPIGGLSFAELQSFCKSFRLRISSESEIAPVSCETLHRDGAAELSTLVFEKESRWRPGTYSVSLSFDSDDSNVQLKPSLSAVKVPTSSGFDTLVETYSAERLTLFQLLDAQSQAEAGRTISYLALLGLLIFLMSTSKRRPSSLNFLCVALLALGFSASLMPKFSANDETAQIDYLKVAQIRRLGLGETRAAESTSVLYDSIRTEMRFSDFYRLHPSVGVVPAGNCPHVIVQGSCGGSEQAIRFFDWSVRALPFMSKHLGDDAKAYLRFGNKINFLSSLIFFAIVFLGNNRKSVIAFLLTIFACSGGVLGFFPSVTNDFALQITGFCALSGLLGIAAGTLWQCWKSRLRLVFNLAVVVASTAAAVLIDRVGILTVPYALLFVFLFLAISIFPTPIAGAQRDLRLLPTVSWYSLLPLFGLMAALYLGPLVPNLIQQFAALLHIKFDLPQDVLVISQSKPFSDIDLFKKVAVNFKSLVGTFNWNSRELPSGFYAATGLAFAAVIFFAAVPNPAEYCFRFSSANRRRRAFALPQSLVLLICSFAIAAHLAVLSYIAPPFTEPSAWTFAVWRIYSPGIIPLGVIGYIGARRMWSHIGERLRKTGSNFCEWLDPLNLQFVVVATYLLFLAIFGLPQSVWIQRF